MERFVDSPGSETVQNQAWLDQMRPTVEIAIEHGWKDGRSLAVATGVANSIGGGGFKCLANQRGWLPEDALEKYVGTNAHRKRREDAINAAFPR